MPLSEIKAQVQASVLSLGLLGATASGSAHAQAVGEILPNMETKEQYGYVAGVVEGLAYARYRQDRPDETGMRCIYDWFYEDGTDRWDEITGWFERHADKPAGPLLFVLIEKECGE